MQHPIGEHALLADGRTAALVDPSSNVAWLCWPRVDSSPCLLGLLDEAGGGTFTVAPEDAEAVVVERGYEPGTLILRTVWRTPRGPLTVRDALACDGVTRLVRTVEAQGQVPVLARAALAPDAACASAVPSAEGSVLRVSGGGLDVAVHAPGAWELDRRGIAECRVAATTTPAAFVLCDAAATGTSPSLDGTREWFGARVPAARSFAVSGLAASVLGESSARSLLRQSAAVLAALRQRDGGIVAAPTTSLPQWPGGSRNWDYRYSWLRDSTLAGLAMVRCGLLDDAVGLAEFIGAATTTLPPVVLRRVDGTPPPPERMLGHLHGYRGARPVRIGNEAADQVQLDVAGEVLELATVLAEAGALPSALADSVAPLADWAAEYWTEPDHGIWEIRGEPRPYTHSRVMAWAGLVGAAGISEREPAASASASRWRAVAAAIRDQVLAAPGALSLHAGGGGPDAALSQLALTGFLAADDPRLGATLGGIDAQLDNNGLLERHLPEADPLAEPCAPFLFPTFWLAEALERSGADGSRHFAAAAAARGSLDLFGEVADPVERAPLGNYPQVQSHAAFILAATAPG